jgi:hypothetical protein
MLARRIAFPDFLDRGGAWWAGGYGCEVAWDAAMLIDLAVLNEAMSSPARKNNKGDSGPVHPISPPIRGRFYYQ